MKGLKRKGTKKPSRAKRVIRMDMSLQSKQLLVRYLD